MEVGFRFEFEVIYTLLNPPPTTINSIDDFEAPKEPKKYGKLKLKFEMVSYQERVVNQLMQINEDNQMLNYYKNKIAKEHMH
uniref:Uncharacterized protein n=1 Tax=Lactuca sativa TaxID=4236 RepID=A0A9R1WIM0_LACSA|nr:hypothetical protein LSAT_V11C100047270 [Lactuca sativa]